MIQFDDVAKEYPDGTVAIENVTFEVKEGTTTVLVGPSGCGKTTTMKLVNRLEDPTSGTVLFDGVDIQQQNKIDLRRNIGYVIQEIGLFDHMTVGENVATVPQLLNWESEKIDRQIDKLLDLMDLPPATYRDQYPTALSGGQRQRVGVARALAADPEVLLMDEPFGALDPITRENLQNEFLEIQEQINTTILFVTHSVEEALKMGDQIAVFDVGEIVRYDDPRSILEEPGSEFVADFIGSDRMLKILQVTRVDDIYQTDVPETQQDVVERINHGPDDEVTPDVVPVHLGDSAQVALSRIMQAETQAIPVMDDGTMIGIVTEERIRKETGAKTPADVKTQ